MSDPKTLCIFLLCLLLFTCPAFGYFKIAETDQLSLYLQENNLALRIVDKKTGYTWSSVIEELVPGENNQSWANFMSSGLSIEYFEGSRTRAMRTDLLGSDGEVEIIPKEEGFTAKVDFKKQQISLEMNVFLQGNELIVQMPKESLSEKGTARLASLYLYPFLGAVRQNLVSGYLFVPDGIGALIEFVHNENKFRTPYEERFFGINEGIGSGEQSPNVQPAYAIKAPVFGIHHLSEQYGPHGIFAIVERGQYNGKLLAYPNGVVTQYNWIAAKFVFRETYSQPTSRGMGAGVVVYQQQPNNEDAQIRYVFLNGDAADYSGMAKTYQSYLQERNSLKQREATRKNIPLQLDFLGAETEQGLFSKNIISMTTVSQMQAILEDVQKETKAELLAVYRGWNKGGQSGRSPYSIKFESKLGKKEEFRDLAAFAVRSGIKLHFYTDYTHAYKEASRFSLRRDGARRINNILLEKPTWQRVYPTVYYLTPQRALELMREDVSFYARAGISSIAVGSTPEHLFSHGRGAQITSRAESAEYYRQGLTELGDALANLALYNPNAYFWASADAYLSLPMYSSQYAFFTRSVPFLPILFKGYLDYFAPYSNFFANQEEELLRLIEYGAYPAFYLTWEPAYRLKHTNSSEIFTSTYADWREVIIRQYTRLNGILSQVEGATIKRHRQLTPEVAAVEYSNGKVVIVNYSSAPFFYGGKEVPAQGVLVGEVR